MNDKKAKELRKQAREQSIGMPARSIIVKKVQHKLAGGFVSEQHHNNPKSTRGVYLALKRATA